MLGGPREPHLSQTHLPPATPSPIPSLCVRPNDRHACAGATVPGKGRVNTGAGGGIGGLTGVGTVL